MQHGPGGALAPAPPGVADVLLGFAQEPPPPEGFSLAGFDERIAGMEAQQLRLTAAGDYRAVFHLTYLSFSKQVRGALAAGRFADIAFAADMCCRFVDAYLHQLQRWDAGDPSQCRAWRTAFGTAQSGRANVLQAMFLGMNAHIHYDLAFVTLGACRAAGDLDGARAEGALSGARSGVPVRRYRDFLLINQIGWESLPLLQDLVLSAFSKTLQWSNKAVAAVTKTVGARLLMGARDTSWGHTALLVHAREPADRMAVAAMIDAHAASHTHAVLTLSANPTRALDGVRRWRDRGTDLPEDARDRLVAMAAANPVVADLVLRQLAFAGANPVVVLEALLAAGEDRLAGRFTALVAAHAPGPARDELQRHLCGCGPSARRAARALLAEGGDRRALPAELAADVRRSWQQLAAEARRCAVVPEVARSSALSDALRATYERLSAAAGSPPPEDEQPPPTAGQARALLAVHPDPWVRACAATMGRDEGAATVSEIVERVLFLKTTPLFMEVDPAELLPVAEAIATRQYSPGQLLVRAGHAVEGIHVVVEGRVRVSQHRGGRPVPAAELGVGDALGELSALNGTPATADCTAVTDVRTAFLPTADLVDLLHRHPRIAIGLLRVLSQRLTATTQQLEGG
jgi:hypothetical protein